MFSSQTQSYEEASQCHCCTLWCSRAGALKMGSCLHPAGLRPGGRERCRAKPLNGAETPFLGATQSDAPVLNSAFKKSKLASLCFNLQRDPSPRSGAAAPAVLPARSRFSLRCRTLEGLSVRRSVRSYSEARGRFFGSAEHPWRRCRADQHCQPCCGVAQ